jgi:hypothetical protein
MMVGWLTLNDLAIAERLSPLTVRRSIALGNLMRRELVRTAKPNALGHSAGSAFSCPLPDKLTFKVSQATKDG